MRKDIEDGVADYLFRDTPRALGLIIDRCVIIEALLWLDQLQRAMRATSHLREMTISSLMFLRKDLRKRILYRAAFHSFPFRSKLRADKTSEG